MTNAEVKQIEEINKYKAELDKTNSNQRKYQLWQHIRKLERELKLYRRIYGNKN